MDREAFRRMKTTAVLINVGRGPIIVEQDLREALEQGEIAAAGWMCWMRSPCGRIMP